jgi:hypothetical protein
VKRHFLLRELIGIERRANDFTTGNTPYSFVVCHVYTQSQWIVFLQPQLQVKFRNHPFAKRDSFHSISNFTDVEKKGQRSESNHQSSVGISFAVLYLRIAVLMYYGLVVWINMHNA